MNPLAEKIGRKCDWGSSEAKDKQYLYKLERPVLKPKARTLGREVHPTARFTGTAIMDSDGRPVGPGSGAVAWAENFPGWELRFA